jgi:hypothetical protein
MAGLPRQMRYSPGVPRTTTGSAPMRLGERVAAVMLFPPKLKLPYKANDSRLAISNAVASWFPVNSRRCAPACAMPWLAAESTSQLLGARANGSPTQAVGETARHSRFQGASRARALNARRKRTSALAILIAVPGCLVIICGLPGSGKTTLARSLESARPAHQGPAAIDWRRGGQGDRRIQEERRLHALSCAILVVALPVPLPLSRCAARISERNLGEVLRTLGK